MDVLKESKFAVMMRVQETTVAGRTKWGPRGSMPRPTDDAARVTDREILVMEVPDRMCAVKHSDRLNGEGLDTWVEETVISMNQTMLAAHLMGCSMGDLELVCLKLPMRHDPEQTHPAMHCLRYRDRSGHQTEIGGVLAVQGYDNERLVYNWRLTSAGVDMLLENGFSNEAEAEYLRAMPITAWQDSLDS